MPTPPSSSGPVNAVSGKRIGQAAQLCQKRCVGSNTGGGVYTCLCTCNKQQFEALGLSWAASIQCTHA